MKSWVIAAASIVTFAAALFTFASPAHAISSVTLQPINTASTTITPEADADRVEDPALACSSESTTDEDCDLIRKYINPIIAFLAALVGVAVTIGIISGGIKYASAGADPSKVAAATKQITNAILALIIFLFLGAALNWLVPGGIGL